MMNFFNDKTLSAIVIIVIMACVLIGCTPKNLETQGPKQPTTLDTVAKMKSVGAIIGCMFAPNDPECEKLKSKKTDEKPHLKQEEYDDQNNKEWDKID